MIPAAIKSSLALNNESSISARSTAPRIISAAFLLLTLAGGLLSLCGWAFDIERFKDWWDTGITIKANTSIAIVACSVALLSHLFLKTHQIARALGMFVAALGFATLTQHFTGLNLGIDTLIFVEQPGSPATSSPGRMGPPACMSFMAIGFALVLLTGKNRNRVAASALALAVLIISALSLVGFWYGAAAMYSIPRLTGISLQTATMLAMLSLGIIASSPDSQPLKMLFEDSDAGMLARRAIPAAIVIPLLLGWLRVQGFRRGLYDEAFGTALRTIMEMAVLAGALWWSLQAFRSRDLQRRRAESERQEVEQRMRSVLDASAVSFTILAPVRDASGMVVDFTWAYLNTAAAKMIGKNAADVIGQRVTVIAPDRWSEPDLFERFVGVAVRDEVHEFETHSPLAKGWFQVIASPLNGSVAVWSADVSQRKRQELELVDADRRKDEFLATLAHELRNPLAPIRQAALVASKPAITEAQRQWCNDVIERQVQHMSLLLEDLLDVSRITRGSLQLRRQPASLSALIDNAVETARPLIERRKHRLNLDLPAQQVVLDVDPLRMSQVVSNLLNNSAKYTNAGGTIDVSAAVVNDALVLSVRDNGIGIANDDFGLLFKMFAQVKAAKDRSEGGLGIGLALTRGLVELHGGTIEASSAGPGKGSTFTIRIPNVVLSSDLGRAASPPAKVALSRRILIADDNVDAAVSLAMLLRQDGHEVDVVHDGESAIAAFAAGKPDAALLDIGMPRLSGNEVAKRLRDIDKSVLLIAITGWGQSADRDQSAAAGFDHHLTKPVDYQTLAKLLEPNARREKLAV